MIELIFLSPLLFVTIAALAIRFGIVRRPFQTGGWVILSLCTAIAFFLPLGFGAWIPDFLFAPHRTLAAVTLPSGHDFRVIQYWNRFDFYSTELHVISPNTPAQVITLDGDDSKSWSVPLTITEVNRIATIILGGGHIREVQW